MHLGKKCFSTLPQCGTCDVMAICVTGWLKGSAMVTCHIAVESYATAARLDPSAGALVWNLGYKRLPCYRDLKFNKVLKLSPRQNSMKFSWSDSRSKMFSDGGGTNSFSHLQAVLTVWWNWWLGVVLCAVWHSHLDIAACTRKFHWTIKASMSKLRRNLEGKGVT